MRRLRVKMRRDLWHMRWRALAIVLTVASGVAIYAGIYTGLLSLFWTRDSIFKEQHFADLQVSFNKFADSALNIQVIHWWGSTDAKAYLAGMQEINLAIKERFDAEGISFAFPTQTIYLKPDSNGNITPPPYT